MLVYTVHKKLDSGEISPPVGDRFFTREEADAYIQGGLFLGNFHVSVEYTVTFSSVYPYAPQIEFLVPLLTAAHQDRRL